LVFDILEAHFIAGKLYLDQFHVMSESWPFYRSLFIDL